MRPLSLKLLLIVLAVAGLSYGDSTGLQTAEARPTDVLSFSQNICSFMVVGASIEDGASMVSAEAEAASDCYPSGPGTGGLYDPANLADLADLLGGEVDDPDTYADLVDATAAQLGEDSDFGQVLWIVTFVTNDDNVQLDADEGTWGSTGFTSSQTDCEPAVPIGIEDEDCDDDGSIGGDGAIVDLLSGANSVGASVADLGDAIVTATQAGIDVEMDYTVVGMPDDLALAATKAMLQGGATDEACDLEDFTGAIANPSIAGLLATVTDEDGIELTGINVDWDTSDEDVVNFALVQGGPDEGDAITTTTSSSSGSAVAALNVGCGGDIGTSAITVATSVNDAIDDEVIVSVEAAATPTPTPTALATPTATVNPSCQISVDKRADDPTIGEGGLATYTITVENRGNGDCTDLTVSDIIPDGTNCEDATVDSDSDIHEDDFDISGCRGSGTVTWETDEDLDDSDTVVLTLVLELDGADEDDSITNEACGTSTSDVNGDCDSARITVGEEATATPMTSPTATPQPAVQPIPTVQAPPVIPQAAVAPAISLPATGTGSGDGGSWPLVIGLGLAGLSLLTVSGTVVVQRRR
jgi:uncharacterized repeat protein (TIGR01451 family)